MFRKDFSVKGAKLRLRRSKTLDRKIFSKLLTAIAIDGTLRRAKSRTTHLRSYHGFPAHVTVGSPYGTCSTRLTKMPGVATFSGSSAPSSTMCWLCTMVSAAAVAITGLKLRADEL